uniref:Uncharacterized protein n=1 Tax=Populus trichocarpa TaxID=3694 RepID=A0A2K1ZKL0_POPTR
MEAGSGGNRGLWGWKWEHKRRKQQSKASRSSESASGGGGYRFPLKQAVTAGSLALTGDTVAQVTDRWRKKKPSKNHSPFTTTLLTIRTTVRSGFFFMFWNFEMK